MARKGAEARLSVATYNAGDVGTPPHADVVGVQEAPGDIADRFTHPMRTWVPGQNKSLAIAWRADRLHLDDKGIIKVHEGRAGVTPGRHIAWATFDTDHLGPIAVIDTHAINNAFGRVIRGERPFRLWAWTKLMRELRQLRKRLAAEGYLVFICIDGNRIGAYMLGMGDASPRQRYDRIFYTRRHRNSGRRVRVVKSKLGPRRRSDHAPIVTVFEISSNQ